MIRALAGLLGALWLAGCGAPAEPERDWPEPSPAIWEIAAPSGERGWLFGTMHSLPDGVEWRTREIDAALAEADLLVVEIVDLEDAEAGFEAWRTRAYSDDLPPLLERVEPRERARVAALVDRAGGELDDYDAMESWAAAIVLAGGLRVGDPANGVDRALLREDKPVTALESFSAQYDLFDTLPAADQADLLLATASEAEMQNGIALTEAWLTGNDHRLDEHSSTGLLRYPRLRQVLLEDRNERWANRIAELVEDGREPFIAVGAAHVIGAYGLLALFEARGYRVRRIQ